MEERELITIGFGNFSNLVAAQWANGTSRFDVHHKTLYYERSRRDICISEKAQGGPDSGDSRALRLLLLDAPHVNYLLDPSEIEGSEDMQKNLNEEDHRVSSLSRHPVTNAWDVNLTEEEKYFERVARFMQSRRTQSRTQQKNSSDCEDLRDERSEEDRSCRNTDSDDENDNYYYPTENAYSDKASKSHHHRDPGALPLTSPSEPPRKKHESETQSGHSKSLRKLRASLFRQKDPLVPWWQYITTGIDPINFTTLHPFHSTAAVGEIPAMHSFGYGLAHFRSESSQDALQFNETLRHHLEDADCTQGLQCFVDGDSLFGGAAHNTLQEFWDDAGPKVPVALFSIFTPLPAAVQQRRGPPPPCGSGLTEGLSLSAVPFANLRCEEVCLNRLLSTSLLSEHTSALYIPIEMGSWPSFFSSGDNSNAMPCKADGAATACWWSDDDVAAAQYLAAIFDTVLYGTRDGGSPEAVNVQEMAVGSSKGPAYYLSEWCQTLRPSSSWRVSALLGSLPLPVDTKQNLQHTGELWSFLEANPLLGSSERGGVTRRQCFEPLSHSMPHSPLSTAGRVLGHALTLRGAGVLPSRVYPTTEAMLRYALPLRTSNYLPLLTRNNYPISSSFPLKILFDSERKFIAAETALKQHSSSSASMTGVGNPERDLQQRFGSTDVGSHVVTTFNSTPMLDRIASEAQKIFRYKAHMCCTGYWMEEEDWKERIEDVLRIRDDYRHEETDNSDFDNEN